jgi:hypothetical protein
MEARRRLWLIEGFADWVAYQVLEALGLDTRLVAENT